MSEYVPTDRQLLLPEERGKYSLLWTGPLMLGSPDAPPFNAYASVIRDVPLGDEEFAMLAKDLTRGVKAEAELRALDATVADLDISVVEKVSEIERARRAKQALIVCHLGLVLEIAMGCLRPGDRAEIIGVGNLALTTFVCEEYSPTNLGSANERQRFEREVTATIMRSLTGYGPRYKGIPVDRLEALWATETTQRKLEN